MEGARLSGPPLEAPRWISRHAIGLELACRIETASTRWRAVGLDSSARLLQGNSLMLVREWVSPRVFFYEYLFSHARRHFAIDFHQLAVVVKAVLGSHFGAGEFTTHFRTYFSGDWHVHWGTGFDPWPTDLFASVAGQGQQCHYPLRGCRRACGKHRGHTHALVHFAWMLGL